MSAEHLWSLDGRLRLHFELLQVSLRAVVVELAGELSLLVGKLATEVVKAVLNQTRRRVSLVH